MASPPPKIRDDPSPYGFPFVGLRGILYRAKAHVVASWLFWTMKLPYPKGSEWNLVTCEKSCSFGDPNWLCVKVWDLQNDWYDGLIPGKRGTSKYIPTNADSKTSQEAHFARARCINRSARSGHGRRLFFLRRATCAAHSVFQSKGQTGGCQIIITST